MPTTATDVQPQPLARRVRPVWVVSAAVSAVALVVTELYGLIARLAGVPMAAAGFGQSEAGRRGLVRHGRRDLCLLGDRARRRDRQVRPQACPRLPDHHHRLDGHLATRPAVGEVIGKKAGDTVTVCLQERVGGPARRA
jgi:hypothetical protein